MSRKNKNDRRDNTIPNRLYQTGERFGRNQAQTYMDLFKEDLKYIDEEDKYSIPEGPNPDDSLVRSRYERLDPQITLKRKHIDQINGDRDDYYKYHKAMEYKPEEWSQSTCNAQILDAELAMRWNLNGNRPENKKNVKIPVKGNRTDLQFNIYNRRPNVESMQMSAHIWLDDLEGPPNQFDVIRESPSIKLVRKELFFPK